MDTTTLILIMLFLLLLAAVLFSLFVRRVIIYEHERGLLYQNGKFQRVLPAGSHWLMRATQTVQRIDARTRSVTIPGQEILSSDNISLKVSLAVTYRVADPFQAINSSVIFAEELYLLLQTGLRDLVGAEAIDDLLAKRKQLGDLLLDGAKERAAALGLELLSVSLKDIMFPGELKNIFAQVVNARKEGLAALERARGESAALRNLANSAKLLEDNPAMYNLRVLQAIGSSSGNTTIILSLDDARAPVVFKKKE